MEIIKFGGKSLVNGHGIQAFLKIIKQKTEKRFLLLLLFLQEQMQPTNWKRF